MSKKKHIQAYIDPEKAEAIDKTTHIELRNVDTFSHRVEVVIDKGLEALGIEVKTKKNHENI